MRFVRAGTIVALAVLVAACSKARAPEAPAEAKAECERCHGYPPQAGSFITAGPDTRVHPDNLNCHLCHPDTVEEDNKTIVPASNGGLHMNGSVEAAGHGDGYVATHGPDALAFLGGGAGSCTSCHTDFGAGSTGKSCDDCHAAVATSAPGWKTNCTFCHGTPTAGVTGATTLVAPPESVLGATGAGDARVGAHQAHLAAGPYANAFACTTCHTVPTDALGHFPGYGPTSSVVPAFDALASTGVTGGATYAGGTCATYCHGSGTEFANPGNHASPAWNAGAGAVTCGTCHGTPPASGPMLGSQSAHELHVAKGATCATCHEGYTETSVDGAKATHVNGVKEVRYLGAAITTGWTNCNTCHRAGNVAIHAIPFGNAHKAAALANIASCTSCHGATYGGGVGRSCNACHALVTTSAPDWKTNCTFCHGTPTANVTAAAARAAPPQAIDRAAPDQTFTNPKVGAHQKHLVAGTFSAPLPCASCHDGLVPTGADPLSHFTGYDGSQADVAFSALAGTGVTGGATYAGGTCATYCHGSGTEFTNPSGKISPAWTSTGLACGDCHGTPPASGPTIGSQSAHAFHGAAGATCATCHGAGYSTTTVSVATHVNGTKDVVANQAWDCSACHAALDVQVAHPLPFEQGHTSAALASIGSCTTCHGTDYGGGIAQSCTACHATRGLAGGAEWTTNCAFCHGTRTAGVTGATPLAAPPQSVLGAGGSSDPRVGAHQAHLTTGEFASAFACATCHTVPTDALGHFDGWAPTSSVVPAFAPLASAGVAGGAAYAGDGGTCATYCHGSGTEFTNPSGQASPAWTSTALACGDCHGTPPRSGPAIASQTAHDFHVAKGATCGTCHEGYTETSVALATHVNGAKDVTYRGAAITTGWTNCNTCHVAGNVAIHALPFGDAHQAGALANIASCTSCHGANYEGGDGPSCNACHGGVATSAPDWKTNCTFCHGTPTANVVTATPAAAPPEPIDGAAADQTFANPRVGAHQAHLAGGTFSSPLPCQSCHAVPTPAEALTHFPGYDGSSADVAFSPLAATGMTGAAYAGSGGTCATYCHGSGSAFANPPGQASPAWTSRGLACGDCHGTPPSSGPTLSGQSAHAFHLAKNTTCDTCHPGYSPTQVVLATHVNGTKDVKAGNQTIQGWDCGTCHTALGVGHAMPYVAQHTGPALADIASCTACHGADYAGLAGVAPSCNACHATSVTASAPDWKQNCTFCHGARTQDVTAASAAAAPPQAVLGGDETPANPKVGAHQAHLTAGTYANALPCQSCHPVADQTDALAHFTGYAGGQADVAFDATASKGAPGTYAGSGGTCAVYCHGAGTQFTNPVAASPAWNAPTGTTVTCGTCHALPPQSGPAYPGPNAHDYHVTTLALACGTCHANYTASSVDVSTHVNGAKDVVVAGGTRITGWDCNACHAALGAPLMHAMPFVADHTPVALANLTGCTDCHGADYGGGTVGVSCNGCHLSAVPSSAPDWKTNCTFCHGTRTANWAAAQRNLPAPPKTVSGTDDQTTANPRVGAHQRHTMTATSPGTLLTVSTGFACTECHPAATDLTHVNGGQHALLQSGPLASANGATSMLSPTTCNTYCHGSSMPGTGRTLPTWAPPSPTGTALNCGSCHQASPTTGQHPAAGGSPHRGFLCSSCHGTGFTANTSVNKAVHVNGSIDKIPALNWSDGPPRSCNPTCHTAVGVVPTLQTW